MFIYVESKLFSFREYSVTDTAWLKTQHITAAHALHMFMVVFFAALDLIAFSRFSEINPSEDSELRKEFQRSKYAGSSNVFKIWFKTGRGEKVFFFHPSKQERSFGSDLLPVLSKNFLYIHKWDLVSINCEKYSSKNREVKSILENSIFCILGVVLFIFSLLWKLSYFLSFVCYVFEVTIFL